MNEIKVEKNLELDSDFGSIFWDLYYPIDCEAKYVVQIAHGMVEYKDRYEWVCESLAKAGFVVAISDHRGHGRSVSKLHNEIKTSNAATSSLRGSEITEAIHKSKIESKTDCHANAYNDKDFTNHISLGEMGKDGLNMAVSDLYKLNRILYGKFPNCKIILLGHSMGSLISRLYLFKYADSISALILSGTPAPNPLIKVAIMLASRLKRFKGNKGAELLNRLSFGGFNTALLKRLPKDNLKDKASGFEWLCRDDVIVKAYMNDPYCSFIFTTNSFHNLFLAMKEVYSKRKNPKLDSKPIIFLSGDMDPCGDFGEGVLKARDILMSQGFSNVNVKLYDGARHEILNEFNKQEVLDDIIRWINAI